MKQYLKLLVCFVLLVGLMISPVLRVVSYADVNDLLISSDSNALMTLELDGDDYGITTFSSLSSITNTVSFENSAPEAYAYDESLGGYVKVYPTIKSLSSSTGLVFYFDLDSDQSLYYVDFHLNNAPSSGVFDFSFDFASDFSVDYESFVLDSRKVISGAQTVVSTSALYPDVYSGDFYLSPMVVRISNPTNFFVRVRFGKDSVVKNWGGTFNVNFTLTNGEPVYTTASSNFSSSLEYENNVSSSLSGLSSSVDSMTEDLSSAAESLEYISTSQNLIIQGIDNVIMHISDQLYAFWDQLYNLIHEPTMAKMDEIIEAINNMDLEIEVNLDGLKQSINNMSQAVQNKLQSVGEHITGGYDNSSIQNENEELAGALNEYDEAEKEVLDDVTGYIDGFEYPSMESLSGGLLGAIAFLGGYLQSIFLSMGDFGLIITFSLTMIFVLIIVGYHRIRT